MRKSKLISRAMFIGGTVALLAGPAWSQEAVGERQGVVDVIGHARGGQIDGAALAMAS